MYDIANESWERQFDMNHLIKQLIGYFQVPGEAKVVVDNLRVDYFVHDEYLERERIMKQLIKICAHARAKNGLLQTRLLENELDAIMNSVPGLRGIATSTQPSSDGDWGNSIDDRESSDWDEHYDHGSSP